MKLSQSDVYIQRTGADDVLLRTALVIVRYLLIILCIEEELNCAFGLYTEESASMHLSLRSISKNRKELRQK